MWLTLLQIGTVKRDGGPEECEQYCLSHGQECVGFHWVGNYNRAPGCELKINADDVARNMKEDNSNGGGSTWLRGTCSDYASESEWNI
jgi:hypothetical protein